MSKTEDQAGSGAQWIVREMTVTNPRGFHVRPASMVAKIAFNSESEIMIEKDGTRVSAKSVMGLLSLEAGHGTRIRVTAEGPDAAKALAKIEEVVSSRTEEQ